MELREPTEKLLCAWAERRKFIVSDRRYRLQMQQEYETDRTFATASTTPAQALIGDLKDIIAKYSIGDFERDIYFPIGHLTLRLSLPSQGPQVRLKNEEDLVSLLNKNLPYNTSIIWRAGLLIHNWNFPNCTMADRTKNELLWGYIHYSSETGILQYSRPSQNHANHKGKRNFLFRAMARIEELEGDDEKTGKGKNAFELALKGHLKLITELTYLARHPKNLSLLHDPEYYKELLGEDKESGY